MLILFLHLWCYAKVIVPLPCYSFSYLLISCLFLFLLYPVFPTLSGCHLLVVILLSFVLPSFRFIPLALTLSVSFLPPPLPLPVWSLLPASPGNHAHQATLQTPLSTFQASLSFIPLLLSVLLNLLFAPWAHAGSLHSAQTHVF